MFGAPSDPPISGLPGFLAPFETSAGNRGVGVQAGVSRGHEVGSERALIDSAATTRHSDVTCRVKTVATHFRECWRANLIYAPASCRRAKIRFRGRAGVLPTRPLVWGRKSGEGSLGRKV